MGLFYGTFNMRQLTDQDIADMTGDNINFDNRAVKSSVRRDLRLSEKIPVTQVAQKHVIIDFHEHTEEQAWNMVMTAAQSGARTATVITGASGILKIKFQQWVRDSLLAPYIVQCTPINNGSFAVKFKKTI